MSEPRETFDLDRAFAELTHDVTTTSTARGAGRAIRSARRRRAAGRVAAVAATVVVGASVAAVSTGVVPLIGGNGDDVAADPDNGSVEPFEPVPPAELTAAALSRATRPWIDTWTVAPSPVLTDAPCLSEDLPEPPASGNEELRTGVVGASHVFSTWLGVEDANEVGEEIRAGFAACRDGEMRTLTSFEVPGADIDAYAYPEGGDLDGVVWLVVSADRLAILTIAGVDAPPARVLEDVGRALVADLSYGSSD